MTLEQRTFSTMFSMLSKTENINSLKLDLLSANVAKKLIVFDRLENIVGKGENVGDQHFLLFLQCFLKPSFLGSLEVRIVWYTVYKRTVPKPDIASKL